MARLLLIGCQTLADDEGLIRWDPDELCSLLFDSDPEVTPGWVMSWMANLVDAHVVLPYRAGRHQVPLAYLRDFERDQKVARPKASQFPAPDPTQPRFLAAYAVRDGGVCGICTGPVFLSPEVLEIARTMTGSTGVPPATSSAPAHVQGSGGAQEGAVGDRDGQHRMIVLGLDLSEAPSLRPGAVDGEWHASRVHLAHQACVHADTDLVEMVALVSRWHYWTARGALFDDLHDSLTLREAVRALSREHASTAEQVAPVGSSTGAALTLAAADAPAGASVEAQDATGDARAEAGMGRPVSGDGAVEDWPWVGAGADLVSPDHVEGRSGALSSVALPDSDSADLRDLNTAGLTEDSRRIQEPSVNSELHPGRRFAEAPDNVPLTCGNTNTLPAHDFLTEPSPTPHAPVSEGSPQEVEVEREVEREVEGVNASRSQSARANASDPPRPGEPTADFTTCAFGAPQNTSGSGDEPAAGTFDPSEADALVEGHPQGIDDTAATTGTRPSHRSLTEPETTSAQQSAEGTTDMGLTETSMHSTPAADSLDTTDEQDQIGLFDMEPIQTPSKTTAKPKRKRPASWTEERVKAAHNILEPWWETYGTGWGQTYAAILGVLIAAMKNGVKVDDLTAAMNILGEEGMAVGGGSITVALRKAAKRQQEGYFVRQDTAYTTPDAYSYRELD